MRKLVVISVDSLFTRDLEEIKTLPGFSEVLENSIIVKNIECIYPTLTYPCHATIITGQYPDTHGITHNELLDPLHNNCNWYWYYNAFKAKTIFDYAKENGLSTAAVLWPVTANAPIDYLIPEIWASSYDSLNAIVGETASPLAKPIYENHKCQLDWKKNPHFDRFGEACLLEIVNQYTPDVVFLHQASLDHARHLSGTDSPLVNQALLYHGEWIQSILDLYRAKGIFDDTTFVILGDHGQLNIQKVVSINEMLRAKGLIETDGKGNILSYKAYMQSAGISGHLYLKDASVTQAVLEVLNEAFDAGYIETVFTTDEASALNLSGDFDYVVEAKSGLAISNQVDVAVVQPVDTDDYKYSKATHGHLPTKGDQPPFIIYNSTLPPQVIPSGKLVDEFPTLMKLLGLQVPDLLPGNAFI